MRSSTSTRPDAEPSAATRRLTAAARPLLAGRPAFRVCGLVGLGAGVAVAMTVVAARGDSWLVMTPIAGAAVGTFLGVATAYRQFTGVERLVYYHHEIAVLCVAAVTAALLRAPVLPYLDATALGIGSFLACGRVGCFMVGCCHGRPHRWGVKYDHAHASGDLPSGLVGVRLFPVQLAEAAIAAGIVAVGFVLVLAGAPGDALTFYVGCYAVCRFFLELARGDVGRPHWRGFSQPQWLSLGCAGAVAALATSEAIPWRPWDAAIVVIAAAMAALALQRRLHAADARTVELRHVHEFVAAVRRTEAAGDGPLRVARTSRGVRVSAGPGHVTLSGEAAPISPALARRLGGYAMGVLEAPGRPEVLTTEDGIFHVIGR